MWRCVWCSLGDIGSKVLYARRMDVDWRRLHADSVDVGWWSVLRGHGRVSVVRVDGKCLSQGREGSNPLGADLVLGEGARGASVFPFDQRTFFGPVYAFRWNILHHSDNNNPYIGCITNHRRSVDDRPRGRASNGWESAGAWILKGCATRRRAAP